MLLTLAGIRSPGNWSHLDGGGALYGRKGVFVQGRPLSL